MAQSVEKLKTIMASNLDKYKQDLDKLTARGFQLLAGLFVENKGELSNEESKQSADFAKLGKPLPFRAHYEDWYSESLEVIRQVLPNRLHDFSDLYKTPKRKEITYETYGLADYMIGLVVTHGLQTVSPLRAALAKFPQQLNILQSVQRRFESSLFDIRQLVQADLLDTELDSSKELLSNGFLRPAGALAGVVLEKHLKQVCVNHNLTITKKNPSISDLNDNLKNNQVIQMSDWRFIQHLGDLRNLCDHNKEKDPSSDQLNDLIAGVEKVTKTIF